MEHLLQAIKTRMPKKRYTHTIGVMQTAIDLAKHYGEDVEKAQIAAILHDIAKYADEAWMCTIIKKYDLGDELLSWGTEIMHGPVGAWIAENELKITDQLILDAITYHTTGRANMTNLEKIIFIADMIEPNRKFPGVDELRDTAYTSLNKGMRACITHSIAHLVHMQLPIFPRSITCYNDYMREE